MNRFEQDVLNRVNAKLVKLAADSQNLPGPDDWGTYTPQNYRHIMTTMGVDPRNVSYGEIPYSDVDKSYALSQKHPLNFTPRNAEQVNKEGPTAIVMAPKDSPLVAAHEFGHVSNANDNDYTRALSVGGRFNVPEETRAWVNGIGGLALSGKLFNAIPEVPRSLEAFNSYINHDSGMAKAILDFTPALIKYDQQQKRLHAPPDRTMPNAQPSSGNAAETARIPDSGLDWKPPTAEQYIEGEPVKKKKKKPQVQPNAGSI